MTGTGDHIDSTHPEATWQERGRKGIVTTGERGGEKGPALARDTDTGHRDGPNRASNLPTQVRGPWEPLSAILLPHQYQDPNRSSNPAQVR